MKNPLSIEAFADWCEKQPADKAYDYYRSCNCALTQYAHSLGLRTPYGIEPDAPIHTSEFWGDANEFWGDANNIAWNGWGDPGHKNWTFGALAQRLRSA